MHFGDTSKQSSKICRHVCGQLWKPYDALHFSDFALVLQEVMKSLYRL